MRERKRYIEGVRDIETEKKRENGRREIERER